MMLLGKGALVIARSTLMPCPCVKDVRLTSFIHLFQAAAASSNTQSLEVKSRIAGRYVE